MPANVVAARCGANSVPPRPLAGFEGPLPCVGKRGEMETKERDGRKHPSPLRNKLVVTVLISAVPRGSCRRRLLARGSGSSAVAAAATAQQDRRQNDQSWDDSAPKKR